MRSGAQVSCLASYTTVVCGMKGTWNYMERQIYQWYDFGYRDIKLVINNAMMTMRAWIIW